MYETLPGHVEEEDAGPASSGSTTAAGAVPGWISLADYATLMAARDGTMQSSASSVGSAGRGTLVPRFVSLAEYDAAAKPVVDPLTGITLPPWITLVDDGSDTTGGSPSAISSKSRQLLQGDLSLGLDSPPTPDRQSSFSGPLVGSLGPGPGVGEWMEMAEYVALPSPASTSTATPGSPAVGPGLEFQLAEYAYVQPNTITGRALASGASRSSRSGSAASASGAEVEHVYEYDYLANANGNVSGGPGPAGAHGHMPHMDPTGTLDFSSVVSPEQLRQLGHINAPDNVINANAGSESGINGHIDIPAAAAGSAAEVRRSAHLPGDAGAPDAAPENEARERSSTMRTDPEHGRNLHRHRPGTVFDRSRGQRTDSDGDGQAEEPPSAHAAEGRAVITGTIRRPLKSHADSLVLSSSRPRTVFLVPGEDSDSELELEPNEDAYGECVVHSSRCRYMCTNCLRHIHPYACTKPDNPGPGANLEHVLFL